MKCGWQNVMIILLHISVRDKPLIKSNDNEITMIKSNDFNYSNEIAMLKSNDFNDSNEISYKLFNKQLQVTL